MMKFIETRKKLYFFLTLFMTFSVYGDSLQSDIGRATTTISDFRGSIPYEVLKNAQGIVTLNEIKGGFIFSGSIGSGLVIARVGKGWSAPSAIGTGAVGFGFQAGGEISDFVLILNTQAAVDAFSRGGSVTLGGNLSIAAGPVGGTAKVPLIPPFPDIYSYSRSQGAFAGVSVEGAVLLERSGDNANFYGRPVSAYELLSGQVNPPRSADALYHQLN